MREDVEHEVDDDSGKVDIQPHGPQFFGDADMGGEFFLQGGDDGGDDKGQLGHGEKDVGDENEEIDETHKGAAFIAHASFDDKKMVIKIAGEEESGRAERFGHIFPMGIGVSAFNGLTAGDQKKNGNKIEDCIEGGKKRYRGVGHKNSPTVC